MNQISIVIPTYNCHDTLHVAIDSALSNGIAPGNIIVVDDGSTDDTALMLPDYAAAGISVIQTINGGPSAARNVGLVAVGTEFVMFLDADDCLVEQSVEKIVGNLFEGDLFLCDHYMRERGRDRLVARSRASFTAQELSMSWGRGDYTPPCSVFWRTSFLRRIGGWTSIWPMRNDDGELVFRAIISGARIRQIHQVVGVYIQHERQGRISRLTGEKVIRGSLVAYKNLVALNTSYRYVDISPAINHLIYDLSMEAYNHGLPSLGAEILQVARLSGLRGHIGSVIHRYMCSIFGVRFKIGLWKLYRTIKSV